MLGLPAGASFDADTLELVWTPGYAQAGVYQVTVIATDDGDGTGTPRSTTLVLPIVVNNANRAPSIGEITSATVQRGAVLSIPFSAVDADGNPLTITIDGLPSFASVTQSSAAGGSSASGVIRFAPGAGHRGDYTITVIAQDNGDGDINQVAAEAQRFVVSVLSPSEAPVVSVPRQSVALVGQTINIPINVSDLDQDALSYLINGLPAGATIIPAAQYGQATLRWTPTAAQAGVHDLSLEVTDRGLPPADAGFVPDPDHPPVPNTTVADLRIVVRASNLAPELIAITAITASIDGDALAGSLTTVTVDEGAALALNITARDPDFDALHWTVQGQPTGMTLVPVVGTNGQHQLQLRWTPGLFAAQGDNQGGAAPGHYRLVVRATDGSATASREIDVVVRNVNQAPRLLPMPLQLVPEGQTLAFTMLGVDNDNDATRMALVYDATTPEGVSFDTASGYFEWTPGADVVDNASADSRAYNFTFSVTDGTDTTLRTVQVRVFDVNRLPEISTARRALLVGQSFNLPVLRSATAQPGALRIHDPDGAAQTAGLVVSFAGLPEGAAYDSAAGVLRWTPGPGQVGDFIVTASVSDGRNTVREAFTLRVVASPEANAPSILVQTTPEAPVLPGQTVVATVRAESFSPIASIQVWMRGAGAGLADWTPVALDGLGRVRLVPTSPGLIELRVTATDADGFSASQTATVRVRDPLDSAAPVLAWGGALAGSATGAPALIDRTLLLQASVGERQLMGWVLEAAPSSGAVVDESAWRTVATQSFAAAGASGLVDLARVDPAQWANGIYQLRLRAWDLAGRTSEISGRLQVDSASKALLQGSASDAVFTLGGHDFVLGRALDARDGLGQDLGNWRLPALNFGLTNDQGGTSALGLPEPWRDGARVWLQVPGSDGLTPQYLSFTLGTAVQALGSQPGAPVVQRPVFSSDAGWSLQAHDGDEIQPVSLQRQGQRLLSQASGLPWVPQGFVLTGPDGTRYSLSASGAVQRITHADGQQWLVSDAGIARVGAADPAQRIEFQRDSAGRIERVVGLLADGQALSIVYRYDSAGRLILARTLYGGDAASTIGYHADGSLMTETVTAQLGAAVGWLAGAAAPSHVWAGTLQAGTPVHLSFVVRDSELASTIRAAGAAGAVIVAVETTGADLQLTATGATVLGRSTLGQRVVTLLRINEAGLKLLTLNGSGAASLRISLAGDLDRDGRIDGSDSAAWEAAAAAGTLASADLDGDGDADAGDRQLLYANYGWRANQAPVAVNAAERRTHTDLDARTLLDDVAVDLDGDALFWRILGSTHGTARLAGDGQTLVFTPDAGYAGMAEVTLQADDGFASGAPMVLRFNVSGAALQAIHILPMAQLRPGEYTMLQAVGDFADEQGVWLTGGYLSWTAHNFSERAPAADLTTGLDGAFLSGSNAGWGHVRASRGAITSARSFEIGGPTQDTMLLALGGLDLYPGAVTLTAPTAGLGSGARQIKLTEVVSGVSVADSPYATYVVGDARVASVDGNGRITALGVGTTQVYALYKSGTAQLTVTVAPPQVLANGAQRVQVDGAGAVLQSAGGVQIAIPAGQFDQPVSVGIQDLALDNLPLALPSNIDLDFTHAFRLDLGNAVTSVPMQLALNVGTAYEAGTEIYVMRRGTILDGNGVEQPVWWVVDNGFVGADGVARTASPPFPGVTSNGDYIVAARRTKFDPKTGAATYKVASISGDAFAMWMQAQTMAMMMAGGSLAGAATATSILALGLGMTPLTILDYSSAASYQREGAVRVEGDTLAVDVPPPVPLLADDPVISRIEAVTPGGNEYKITGSYFKLVGQPNVEVQVWLKPVGSGLTELTDEPDRALVWRKLEILSSDYAQLVVRVPEGTAVGLHEFQVKRVVQYRDELGPVPGFYVDQGNPSNAVQLDPQPAVGLVLDRRNLQFTQGSSRFDPANPPSDTGVDPIRVLGEGISLPSYLTGTKTDALAFGPDGRLAFVAAAGRVYMIDMTTRKLVYTIEVEGVPMNITSLAAAGEWLYMAEGNGYGNTAAARLMRINVDAKSPDFLKLQQQLQLPGSIGNGGPGFLDLAVSGGRYLGVTMPRQGGGVIGFGVRDKGDVIVIDLATMQAAYEERARLTGGADRRLIVSDDDVRLIDLGSTGTNAGKAPKFIAPGTEAGQFVVGTPGSYNGGFIAFTAKRPTADAALTVTAPVAPRLNPGPQWYNKKYYQNIQHASGVAVSADGKYAFVLDRNFIFDEIGFLWGNLVNKQVGGKIGIIEDPFGPNPKYLGASTPIEGGSLEHLSISPDGRSLLATAWVEEYGGPGDGYYSRLFSTVFQFDANAIIAAAKANTDPMKPFDLNNGNLHPRRYDTLPKSWAVATLAAEGELRLLSPTTRTQSDARPVFRLDASQDITELRIYVSSFAPGEGLFPGDRPAVPPFGANLKGANGEPISPPPLNVEHLERILTTGNLLEETGVLRAGQVFSFDDFADSDAYAQLQLTAGQRYYWGVIAVTSTGRQLTASQEFKVQTARDMAELAGTSVTVITHGYQPPLVSGLDGRTDLGALLPNGALKTDASGTGSAQLARQIAADQGGYAYLYNRQTGAWESLKGAAGIALQDAIAQRKPVVLVPDWVLESGWSDSGFAEAAADAIYASLVQAETQVGGGILGANLHLIAHSRGTVVNSELAQRILWGVEKYAAPRPADLQMTTLDPHDFEQPSLIQGERLSSAMVNAAKAQFAGALLDGLGLVSALAKSEFMRRFELTDNAFADFAYDKIMDKLGDLAAKIPYLGALGKASGVLLDLVQKFETDPAHMGLTTIDFSQFYDPDVFAWLGIDFADNYFQHVADENAAPGTTVTPNGRSLTGLASAYPDAGFDFEFDLTGLKGFLQDDRMPILGSQAISHSRPHSWYAGTISSSLDYFSAGRTGKNPPSARDWIIRRQADSKYERQDGMFDGTVAGSPYDNTRVAPWYLQRLDQLVGRAVSGTPAQSGLAELVASRSGQDPADTWEGVGIGWFFSKLGGGADERITAGQDSRVSVETDNTEFGGTGTAVTGVYNGNFQASVHPFFGRYLTSYELPGWAMHNGAEASQDTGQALQLMFKKLNEDALAADGLGADAASFRSTLAYYQGKFGTEFTLGSFASFVDQKRLRDWLTDLMKDAMLDAIKEYGEPIGEAITNAIGEQAKQLIDALVPLVTDSLPGDTLMEVGEFGLMLQKYAEWGFQLSATAPTLVHNRMVLPKSAQQLSLEVDARAMAGSSAELVILLLDDDGAIADGTVLATRRLSDLPAGRSTLTVDIPSGLRPNTLQTVRLAIQLRNAGAADRAVIDNVNLDAAILVTDSSGSDAAARDQTVVFFQGVVAPMVDVPEGLTRLEAFGGPGLTEHRVTLTNATSGALTFTPTGDGTAMSWDWQVHPRGWLRVTGPLVGPMGRRMERRIWAGMKRLVEAREAGTAP